MGNLDPIGFLKAYGIDPDTPTTSKDHAYDIIKAEISKYSPGDLELKNMEHGFTGQICYTPKHWRETTMGKAASRHPVVDYKQVLGTSSIPPVPFPSTSDRRPLAGIKIVEIGRVIALPAAGALLAALGADVIAIQSPNLANFGVRNDKCHINVVTNVLPGLVAHPDHRKKDLFYRPYKGQRQETRSRAHRRSGCYLASFPPALSRTQRLRPRRHRGDV